MNGNDYKAVQFKVVSCITLEYYIIYKLVKQSAVIFLYEKFIYHVASMRIAQFKFNDFRTTKER